jgi:hypothetical protein
MPSVRPYSASETVFVTFRRLFYDGRMLTHADGSVVNRPVEPRFPGPSREGARS